MRRRTSLATALAATLSVAGCVNISVAPRSAPVVETRAPVTILVSVDGFRPDYRDRGVTPHLDRLAATGVSAAMRPSFPSKTFPNHWTLVTGLVPDRHGIVGNAMDDPGRPAAHFTMATDDPAWWSAAEPIWVTAEKAGIRTASMFWPGANVAWGGGPIEGHKDRFTGGVRPRDWEQFNQAVSGVQRVDTVIDWLRRPAANRPRFVTLYFDTVDEAGHEFGPDSREVTDAVAEVDARIGQLVEQLAALGQPANLVIVADHGMAATADTRVFALDRIADPADYKVEESGVYASLFAVPGHEAALEAALFRKREHLQCWRKADIPARFHYGANPRVPPYLCLPDSGWLIEKLPTDKAAPPRAVDKGAHGYDNDAPSMRALFVANGPAFRRGVTLPTFDNVDIAPLLRDLLGLPPGQGLDGDDTPFRKAMTR